MQILQRGHDISKKDWKLLHVAVVAMTDRSYIGRLFFGDAETNSIVWDCDCRPSDACWLALKVTHHLSKGNSPPLCCFPTAAGWLSTHYFFGACFPDIPSSGQFASSLIQARSKPCLKGPNSKRAQHTFSLLDKCPSNTLTDWIVTYAAVECRPNAPYTCISMSGIPAHNPGGTSPTPFP